LKTRKSENIFWGRGREEKKEIGKGQVFVWRAFESYDRVLDGNGPWMLCHGSSVKIASPCPVSVSELPKVMNSAISLSFPVILVSMPPESSYYVMARGNNSQQITPSTQLRGGVV
jgi:hypothetical protein